MIQLRHNSHQCGRLLYKRNVVYSESRVGGPGFLCILDLNHQAQYKI